MRVRNDPGQYDELASEWWRPNGAFEALHWIAEARARLIPPAARAGAILLDLGCGAGLLAPHVRGKGYWHVGADLSASALSQAALHGVEPVRANVQRLPFRDGIADVVSAGEILEHVQDLPATIAEACRVLRPGGLLVLDTIANTPIAALLTVTIGERVPGGAPPGIHDPALFVDRRLLVRECARHGIALELRGVRPSFRDAIAWATGRAPKVRMVPTRSTAVLFQGRGVKQVT
jgi:2-polyprenyl-6-hydroxyphenyl methylase/3-demethylubiquinone-9 3-methyltransferase